MKTCAGNGPLRLEHFQIFPGFRRRLGRAAFERRLEIAACTAQIAQLLPEQPALDQCLAIAGPQLQGRLDVTPRLGIAFEGAARAGPQHQKIGAAG